MVYELLLKSTSKVLTPTLTIARGGHGQVKIQFTIPFVNRQLVYLNAEYQDELKISIGVHGGSVACDDLNKNFCEKKCMLTKNGNRISTIPMTGKLFTISQSTIKMMSNTISLTNTSHCALRRGAHPVPEAKYLIGSFFQIFR